MADKEQEKLEEAEFERLAKQYAVDKFEEMNMWGNRPGRLGQGIFLSIRRVSRFGFYSFWRSLPILQPHTPYTRAYQTFAVRNHSLLLGLSVLTLAFSVTAYGRAQGKGVKN